jgi:DNA-binding GntR family transcriptional regulator
LGHDLNTRRPLEIIQDEYGLQPIKAEQAVRAGLSDSREMKHLGLSLPVPVLILERRTLLRNGEVVEFSRSIYISDRVELILSLDLSRWTFRVGDEADYALPE